MSPTEYQFLLTTPYFRTCTLSEIATFYTHLEVCSVNARTYLFQQGEVDSSWYLIRSGSVLLKRRGTALIDHVLSELSVGEGFGETGLLEKKGRLATAETLEPTIVYKLSGDTFNRLLDERDPVANRMLRAMVVNQSQRLREMIVTLQDITEVDYLGEYTPMPNPLDVNAMMTASLFSR